jgi:hypothetical protein
MDSTGTKIEKLIQNEFIEEFLDGKLKIKDIIESVSHLPHILESTREPLEDSLIERQFSFRGFGQDH